MNFIDRLLGKTPKEVERLDQQVAISPDLSKPLSSINIARVEETKKMEEEFAEGLPAAQRLAEQRRLGVKQDRFTGSRVTGGKNLDE